VKNRAAGAHPHGKKLMSTAVNAPPAVGKGAQDHEKSPNHFLSHGNNKQTNE